MNKAVLCLSQSGLCDMLCLCKDLGLMDMCTSSIADGFGFVDRTV